MENKTILVLDKTEFYNELVEMYFIGENNDMEGCTISIDKLHTIIFDYLNKNLDTTSASYFKNEPTIQQRELRDAYYNKIRNNGK